jgi:hypothetical protein
MQAAPLFKHRADYFETLAEIVQIPDYKYSPDRRLFAQITGDIGDGSDVTLRSVTVTGDDMAAAKAKAEAFEAERFGIGVAAAAEPEAEKPGQEGAQE